MWPDSTWHWLYICQVKTEVCVNIVAIQHIPLFNSLTGTLSTFSTFSANEERDYCFWKHKNRKFSQGRHVQEQGWAVSPCLFPSETAVSALHTMAMTSRLLPDRRNLATCTLFPLWQNIFIDSDVELTNPLERRVCSGCFLFHLLLHWQRGWIIVQQHVSGLVCTLLSGLCLRHCQHVRLRCTYRFT